MENSCHVKTNGRLLSILNFHENPEETKASEHGSADMCLQQLQGDRYSTLVHSDGGVLTLTLGDRYYKPSMLVLGRLLTTD